jgi:hypothetical protein
LGRSTRFLADLAPQSHIVAINHWQDSPEHLRDPEFRAFAKRFWPSRGSDKGVRNRSFGVGLVTGGDFQAAPTPLFGPQNQIGAQRVAFNISAHPEEMAEEGFESSLVQMTRSCGTTVSVPAR